LAGPGYYGGYAPYYYDAPGYYAPPAYYAPPVYYRRAPAYDDDYYYGGPCDSAGEVSRPAWAMC
jgi:hypothetical protein